ncbi:LytR/AlgR family response regulator transcription factor [Tenacibaculum sp. MEBiC06402]|uniref:LytR/AlgR family response regulator transcription factor n=1 Tax=unclassified Tenacibaculum TaxID=2635139 RepID=UPI003B9BEFFA
MNCIIIEDEILANTIIEDYVNKVPFLNLKGSFRSPLKALDFVIKETPELIFLDINMPDINGLEFLENLPYKPYIIFTTAYSEYALKGYEYNTLDYLLKPIRFNRFLKAVTKAKDILKSHSKKHVYDQDMSREKESFFVKNNQGTHQVKLDELVYVESMKNYIIYNLLTTKIEVKKSLSEIEKELSSRNFVRVHRSYIVNVNFIKALKYDGVTLYNLEIKLPVGRNYRDKLKEFLLL